MKQKVWDNYCRKRKSPGTYYWYKKFPSIKALSANSSLFEGFGRSSPSLLFFFFNVLKKLIWLCCTACWVLVPWPAIEPMPPAVEACSLNHFIVWLPENEHIFWERQLSQQLGMRDMLKSGHLVRLQTQVCVCGPHRSSCSTYVKVGRQQEYNPCHRVVERIKQGDARA